MCHFALCDDQQMAGDSIGLTTDDSGRSTTNRSGIPQNDFEFPNDGDQDFYRAAWNADAV